MNLGTGQGNALSVPPLCRVRIAILVFLVVSILLGFSIVAPCPANPGPGFEELPSSLFPEHGFPVFRGSQELVQNTRADFDRELVEYSLVQAFPADAVIHMYEEAFRKKNLVPDPEEGYPMRRWEYWDQGGTWQATNALTEAPTRYVASWITPKRTVRTVLILRYDRTPGDEQWRQRLHVHLSHQKLFRLWDLLPWP